MHELRACNITNRYGGPRAQKRLLHSHQRSITIPTLNGCRQNNASSLALPLELQAALATFSGDTVDGSANRIG